MHETDRRIVPPLKLNEPPPLPTSLPFPFELPDLEAPGLAPPLPLDASSIATSSDHEYPLLDLPPLPSLSHPVEPIPDIGEDIWRTASKLESSKSEAKLLSWESFFNPSHHAQKPQPRLLSEAGAETFDAAVEARAYEFDEDLEAGNVIRSDALLRSLWQLAIGRNSVLFSFDENIGFFKQTVSHTRASGCTVECSQSLIDDFVYHGTAIRRLRAFEEAVYEDEETAIPTKVALANVVSCVLNAIEQFFVEKERGVRSLLQLQDLLERAAQPIAILERAVEATAGASSDVEVVEMVFQLVDETEEEFAEAQDVLLALLQRVSQPWFQQVGESIGLSGGSFSRTPSGSDVNIENSGDADEIDDADPLPNFLTAKDKGLLSETRRCFRYMQQHYPTHPLSQARPRGVEAPQVNWEYTWEGLEDLGKKAKDYEASLADALRAWEGGASLELGCGYDHQHEMSEASSNTDTETVPFSNDIYPSEDRNSMTQRLETSIAALSAPLSSHAQPPPDTLHTHTLTHLNQPPKPSTTDLTIPPPLPPTPSLSLTPLLQTRHTALTRPILSSILHQHTLTTHLHALSSFSLFTSGLFTSTLRTVLFSTDSDIQGSERKRGEIRRGGTMGLRLGSGERKAWPPTSGEVGLVLRGVVEDVWRGESSKLRATPHAQRTNDAPGCKTALPGDISLTIRNELPTTNIDAILDPSSLHALDFLRISYHPPAALAPLFPAKTLDLYDRIFALWLRLLRVDDAVTKLRMAAVSSRGGNAHRTGMSDDPETQRFTTTLRISHKTTSFTRTLLTHFRLIGVSAPWASFVAQVEKLSKDLSDPHERETTASTPVSATSTLSSLRAAHIHTLETVSANLLLGGRARGQKGAEEALEEACEGVLKLAGLVCGGEDIQGGDGDEEIGGGDGDASADIQILRLKETEMRFDSSVRAFVDEVRALADGVGRDGDRALKKGKKSGDERGCGIDERGLRGNLGELVMGLGWWDG